MAEWSNAAVLKTVDLHGSGGSNPSLSAKSSSDTALIFLWILPANLQAFFCLMVHLCKDLQVLPSNKNNTKVLQHPQKRAFKLYGGGLPPRLIASRLWRLRYLVGDGSAVRIPLLFARSPAASEGKGVKRSERASAVANPSPQHKPTVCRMLFLCPKRCTKNAPNPVSIHFYIQNYLHMQ